MEYTSRRYLDSMANLYYRNNFYNDVVCERGYFESRLPVMHQAIKDTITTGTISRVIASDT
jgi:hypothetical protein